MKRLTTSLIAAAPAIVRDAIGVAGAGAIVVGVAMMHVAIGVIVAGLLLVATAWLLARRS